MTSKNRGLWDGCFLALLRIFFALHQHYVDTGTASNEWCTMQWVDGRWKNDCRLPKICWSPGPFIFSTLKKYIRKKKKKSFETCLNLPKEAIFEHIISGWISIPAWKVVVQYFPSVSGWTHMCPWYPSTCGCEKIPKPRRFRLLGKWSTASSMCSSSCRLQKVAKLTLMRPILLGRWQIIRSNN